MEAPDGAVVARHVFLEGELCGELAHQPIVVRRAAGGEDARLARTAEELLAHRRVLPAEPRFRLDEHRAARRGERFPCEALRHGQAAAFGERLEARLVQQRVGERRLVQQQGEVPPKRVAIVLHQREAIVVVVEERHRSAVLRSEPAAGAYQRIDDRVAPGAGRQRDAARAVA